MMWITLIYFLIYYATLIVGFYTLAYSCLPLLINHLLPKSKVNLRSLGKWAVITGPTDGIGKAIAFELGKRGIDLFLIGRSLEKLEATKTELHRSFPTLQLRTFLLDFNKDGNEGYRRVEKEIRSLDSVGILVNSAGVSYDHPTFFENLSSETIDTLIKVNLESTYRMTHIVYKGMLKQRKGVILCLGSGASELPCSPTLAVYAGVKGGIDALCRSLRPEFTRNGVYIHCQVPLLITSKLSKVKRPRLSIPSSKSYAACAIQAMESEGSYAPSTVSPYWPHTIILKISQLLPSSVFAYFMLRRAKRLMEASLQKSG